jgi:serine/tyrosine/threonine adenylyltransferase
MSVIPASWNLSAIYRLWGSYEAFTYPVDYHSTVTSNAPPSLDLFQFDNTYARELQGFYVPWTPTAVSAPRLLRINESLASELDVDAGMLNSDYGARIFSGSEVPVGATPLAQAYAGHQFGRFSPQLGDGRAVLLGEVLDRRGQRRDIALKGSGRTAFSRGGDGKAAVGPMLREYLISEAMHALGIPTTRVLAVVETGEQVVRERLLPGAVLARVAASHVRVGTFQFFAARGEDDKLRTLADYVIARHDPHLQGVEDRYLALLRAVTERQASLVAQWMCVGFIHGVMNTDNMALSGETIDYGPCAFMEGFNPATVFSSIDTGGRYAYGNQPGIAAWNLARFAETLLPLIDTESTERAIHLATEVVQSFPELYGVCCLNGMRAKLGLTAANEGDLDLANEWLALLEQQRVDYTLAWRRLAEAATGNVEPLACLFADSKSLLGWLDRWRRRTAQETISPELRGHVMRQVNPVYIPRNQRVEEALSAASDRSDLTLFEQLLAVIARPFEERPGLEQYTEPAPPEFAGSYKTFCGT